MTLVKFSKKECDYNISIQGHAEAPRTEANVDLVCCSVSTLGYLLFNAINQRENCEEFIYDSRIPKMKAKFNTRDRELMGVINAVADSLRELSAQYPEYIKAEIDENIKII